MKYEVLYHARPTWLVGEGTAERDVRTRKRAGELVSEQWPDDYAGKVIAIREVDHPELPSLRNESDKLHPVIVLDLGRDELAGLRSRTLKIKFAEPVPVTFDDRWGAISAELRERFADAEAAEHESMVPPESPDSPRSIEARQFAFRADILRKALSVGEIHTGTGLYATKATPTKLDDTQSGAPAGQVITLTTGGLGTADAYKGGYITNVTETETRAIVSHTDTTVTLEGDLTNWTNGDDLDVYDAWSTIQGSLDQLWTDQGAATFTAAQIVRFFAGTYDEILVPNGGFTPNPPQGYPLILEGDPTDSRADMILSPSAGGNAIAISGFGMTFRHFRITGAHTGWAITGGSGTQATHVEDCEIVPATSNGIHCYNTGLIQDCLVDVSGADRYGVWCQFGRYLHVERCDIRGVGKATASYPGVSGAFATIIVEGSDISGFKEGVKWDGTYHAFGLRIANSTIYECARGFSVDPTPSLQSPLVVTNVIFKDVTYPYYLLPTALWPEETATRVGTRYVLRNNCYHGYTNFAYDGTTTKTYAQFTAYGQVDAAGDLDATDPLMTDPANDDFSLQAASPCRHAGHGSGVVTGQNDVAFDAHHPDIGAWSSGALTVAAPTLVSATDDESGTTATLALTADNVLDVLSVYYRKTTEPTWTLFGSTRTGTGTLQVTGLDTSRYVFRAVATRGGEVSPSSNVAWASVTSGATLPPEKAVRQLLIDNASVAALVGQRVFAADAPQTSEKPYIIYQVIDSVHRHHMEGSSGLVASRIQIECYAARYDGVKTLAAAVRDALDAYSGTVTSSEGSLYIDVWLNTSSDGYELPSAARGEGLHRTIEDYMVSHAESIPTFA